MPRGRNTLETVKVTLSTTPQVRDYLKALVDSGLYGKTASEAADRLIARGVEQLVRDGILALKQSGAESRREP